jgi:putative ABC transport system ATP-binding protein
MLSLKKVSRTYGRGDAKFTALKSLDIKFDKGETVAIVGKSGSGKSTLLHILTGLDTPSTGDVFFNDESIHEGMDTNTWRGENVGVIFQQFFLQPSDSVLENASLPLKIRGVKKSERKAAAEKALKLVGLGDRMKSKANDLSGGQKQRVAIARAVVTEPSILVADEPTGNLDSENGALVEKLLFDLNKKLNTTLIIVTHDEELASRCSRIVRLKDGVIIEDKLTSKSAPKASSMNVETASKVLTSLSKVAKVASVIAKNSRNIQNRKRVI